MQRVWTLWCCLIEVVVGYASISCRRVWYNDVIRGMDLGRELGRSFPRLYPEVSAQPVLRRLDMGFTNPRLVDAGLAHPSLDIAKLVAS